MKIFVKLTTEYSKALSYFFDGSMYVLYVLRILYNKNPVNPNSLAAILANSNSDILGRHLLRLSALMLHIKF